MKNLILFSLLLTMCNIGCLHKVSREIFPKSSSEIDFKSIEQRLHNKPLSDKDYVFTDGREFLLKTTSNKTEEEIIIILEKSLASKGFKISESNIYSKFVIGERGMTMYEWKSIFGIYYQINESNELNIYFLFKVSQDITGNLPFNEAENMAFIVAKALK